MYAPNRGASQYIRQILTAIKEERNSNTIIVTKVGNFNTSLSSTGRSSREKINKESSLWSQPLQLQTLITSTSHQSGGRAPLWPYMKASHGKCRLLVPTGIEAIVRPYTSQLPWWLRWERTCLQCRRPRFDPWVRKIPWRRKWLSHSWGIPWTEVGYSPWAHKQLDKTEWLILSLFTLLSK